MEIPVSAYASTVTEGKMYFFKSDCPVGVSDHIHVCIKRGDTIFLFATGSSQVEKAIQRARVLNFDLNTYPVFTSNGTNMLNKDQTFIDCNNPIELTHTEFSKLLKNNKVYEMSGHFDANSLAIIIKGVKCSTVVEQRIKDML